MDKFFVYVFLLFFFSEFFKKNLGNLWWKDSVQNKEPKLFNFILKVSVRLFRHKDHVNKQNCRIWGTQNPTIIVEQQMHPLIVRCTVWCGITSEKIIGPYFFENDEKFAVNVNGIQYQAMIANL